MKAASSEQEDVLDAFASGRLRGLPQPVQRIDTHMSSVFLTRNEAFKVKLARRHPFADLRRLEVRRRLCERELELNRPMARGIYRAVEAVTRRPDGSLEIGGPGPAVEWFVRMRRFRSEDLLSQMASSGRLDMEMADQCARAVARLHAALSPLPAPDEPRRYVKILAGLRRTFEAALPEARTWSVDETAAARQVFERLLGALRRLSPVIAQRAAEGWVRRGHGDLHLRNLCLFGGTVTAFDALEFDEFLACGDVLYDVAFLLMDLRAHGLEAQASCAMNVYLDRLRMEPHALALLAPFMALRAAIRMSVLLEGGDIQAARSYLRLAGSLLEPTRPTAVRLLLPDPVLDRTAAFEVAASMGGPCGARVARLPVGRRRAAGLHRILEAGASLVLVGALDRPGEGLEDLYAAFGRDLRTIVRDAAPDRTP